MIGSSKKWIEAGYELFAKDGPEGINVERLAKILDLNKSGFYHYFGDREIFLYELRDYHHQEMNNFYNEISFLRCFVPDYLNLLIKYQTSFFVQMQLRRHENLPIFKDAFDVVKEKTEKKCLRLWATYINLPVNDPAALKLWKILGDVFFMRLTPEKMNLEFMRGMTEDVREIVFKIQQNAVIVNKPFSVIRPQPQVRI